EHAESQRRARGTRRGRSDEFASCDICHCTLPAGPSAAKSSCIRGIIHAMAQPEKAVNPQRIAPKRKPAGAPSEPRPGRLSTLPFRASHLAIEDQPGDFPETGGDAQEFLGRNLSYHLAFDVQYLRDDAFGRRVDTKPRAAANGIGIACPEFSLRNRSRRAGGFRVVGGLRLGPVGLFGRAQCKLRSPDAAQYADRGRIAADCVYVHILPPASRNATRYPSNWSAVCGTRFACASIEVPAETRIWFRVKAIVSCAMFASRIELSDAAEFSS